LSEEGILQEIPIRFRLFVRVNVFEFVDVFTLRVQLGDNGLSAERLRQHNVVPTAPIRLLSVTAEWLFGLRFLFEPVLNVDDQYRS